MQNRNFDSLQKYFSEELLSKTSENLNERLVNIKRAMTLANELLMNSLLDNYSDESKINKFFVEVDKIRPIHNSIFSNLSRIGTNSTLDSVSLDFLNLFFDINQNVFSKKISIDSNISIKSSNVIIKMSSILILCYISKEELYKNQLVAHFEVSNNNKYANNEDKTIRRKNNFSSKSEKLDKNLEINQKKELSDKAFMNKKFKFKTYIVIFSIIICIALLINFALSQDYFKKAPSDNIKEIVLQDHPQPIEGEDIIKLGDFIDVKLPSDQIITIPEKGIEKVLLDIILDKSKSLDDSSYWLVLDRILFINRDHNYKVDSEEQLKNLALILTSFPKVQLLIACYTDNLGNNESNLELSKKRAESIKLGLVALGVDDKRLKTEGFGGSFPIANNDNAINQKTNRRVSIKIIAK